jgi:hypothetical protein
VRSQHLCHLPVRGTSESGNDEVPKISRNCQTSPGTPVKDQAELVSTISRTCVNDQVEPE